MTKQQKTALLRLAGGAAVYVAVILLCSRVPMAWYGKLICHLVPYLLTGWPVIRKAVGGICRGQVFDENFLMCIASVGAFAVGEYTEAVAVVLFYRVGEWFEHFAVDKSRKSIADLMDICPEYANLETESGVEQVDPEEVPLGAVIQVRPGERIPLDGVVLSGVSRLDTSALTGESLPRRAEPGDSVASGCINGKGLLRIQTTHAFEDSTVSRILELVENAADKKAKTEAFITRFARYYTPVVVIAALCLAVVPPLFLGNWLEWIRRACILLVISCPCALVISVPMTFFSGIGAASRVGVLVKGGSYLEVLARADTVVFDKTGTLTRGDFSVANISPLRGEEKDLLSLAALAEGVSDHPIARAVTAAAEERGLSPEEAVLLSAQELPGRGVKAELTDGTILLAGNRALLEENGVNCPSCDHGGTMVWLAKSGECLGHLVISDTMKESSAGAVTELNKLGIRRTVMLTGDREATAKQVMEALQLDEYRAELLPGDKVGAVEELMKKSRGALVYVGDGINDAPVLSRADVGIAMGALGSDAAIEAADVVLMDDSPARIPLAIRIARKTCAIVRQNIVFALGVKGLFLLLGAFGLAGMWEAVFADVGVAALAILNAMRALRIGETDPKL